MKKKGASIFALWEKAAKAKKTASTSTPNPPPVEVESQSPAESNLQLATVEAQDDDEANDETRAPQLDTDIIPPTLIVEDDIINQFQKGDRRVIF